MINSIQKINACRILLKWMLFFLVFSYIYSIKYKYHLHSLVILGIWGGGLNILHFWYKDRYLISKKVWNMVMMLIAFCFLYLIVILINDRVDYFFIKEYVILDLLTLVAVYPVVILFRRLYGEMTFPLVAKFVTNAVLLQNVLSVLMFFSPEINTFLLNLLTQSDLNDVFIEGANGFRLIGFGSAFFSAGITNSVALILTAVIINFSILTKKQLLWYILVYLLIFFIGIMMSRTTLVGFVISLVVFCYKSKIWELKITSRMRVILKSIIFSCLFVFFVLTTLPSTYTNKLDMIVHFGFEFAYNYFESGKLETKSSNGLLKMFDKVPDNLKTWLIGDGLYRNPMNPEMEYYKNTDVGFLRIIHCVGIIGLLYFILFQGFVVSCVIQNNNKIFCITFVLLYVLFLCLNLKGVTDLFRYLILFFFMTPQAGKNVEKLNVFKLWN
ncbi:MAG: hypothetical protein BHV68_02965 [Bacteroidales bacterium 43_8]|nr:MAG: hypothetical protein BHV68_02965 [Bacteroidales bacterium 43_8]